MQSAFYRARACLAAFAAVSMSACTSLPSTQDTARGSYSRHIASIQHGKGITVIYLKNGQKICRYPDKTQSRHPSHAAQCRKQHGDGAGQGVTGSFIPEPLPMPPMPQPLPAAHQIQFNPTPSYEERPRQPFGLDLLVAGAGQKRISGGNTKPGNCKNSDIPDIQRAHQSLYTGNPLRVVAEVRYEDHFKICVFGDGYASQCIKNRAPCVVGNANTAGTF